MNVPNIRPRLTKFAKHFSISLLLVTTPTLAAQISDEVKQNIQARVDFGLLKGVSIAIADSNGIVYYNYGKTGGEHSKSVDEHTLFEIGSITKVFTATLLADAVINNTVSLDDSINQYLPTQAQNKQLSAVTLKSLANHHSGLGRLPANLLPSNPLDPYADFNTENLYQALQLASMVEDPSYQYSNFGAGLLGNILTLVESKPYNTLIKENITQPLALSNTYVGMPPNNDSVQIAYGHHGMLVPNWQFDALVGAGGIVSTTHDLIRFLKAQLISDKNATTRLAKAFKLSHQITESDIANNLDIGLAWFALKNSDQRNIIFHDGNTNGYSSFAGFSSDGNIAVVVLSNSGSELINDIGLHLLDSTMTLHAVPAFKEVKLNPGQLKKYVGEYHHPLGLVFKVIMNGIEYTESTKCCAK